MCPKARYVFLLRHPVDRFWSAVCMHLRSGKITSNELRDWPSVRRLIQRPNYVARSFPSKIWERWTSHVPADSIRYWFLDDIIAAPSRVRTEIMSHIGIDEANHDLPSNYNRKSGSEKVPMPADVAAGLAEWFRQEIADCRKAFGGAANNWAI